MPDWFSILDNPAAKGAGQLALLIFARLMPVIAFTPIFGGQQMPKRLRMGISVFMTLAMLPLFTARFDSQPPRPAIEFIILMGKEMLVGLTLAFILLAVFEAIAAVGAIIDLARGATLANVFDPLTQNQQSILATFFTQFAVVLFMSLGGIQILVRELAISFLIFKPYELLPARLFGPEATTEAITIVAEMMLVAVKISAPAVVILLIVDFALGVINRVASQIQVYFLGMTTKGVVGLMVVLAGIALTVELFTEQFAGALEAVRKWSTGAAA